MTPIFIPIPSGNLPIGAALLQLFVVVGALIYFSSRDPYRKKKGPTPEQLSEKRKQEAFYRALIDASKERKKGTP